ncbi:tetratricopeptide repeat protein 19 homolog, mitochondrial [Galleria mellonella]|uniref:Tetratricopeptide repeat protein 19 homolog, mitochondrial n=1 Tax=Galleria mellonella TaxID=7137 RepID=A0A6J1X1P5_GALME|nr:tetratricopeptide repeat protein 19 homolog, mitochondrial [Galleria mellonella]
MYRFRLLWTSLSPIKKINKVVPVFRSRPIPRFKYTTPVALSFSLFTWLGFQKKLSMEDELILTIKHCVLFIERGDYEKAEQLLHVALRQAQQFQHQLGITYIYDVMANLALERNQLDAAKQLFIAVTQRIMADGATEDDTRVVHISVKLARISHLKKDYQTAQIGYDWCIEKLKKALSNDPDIDILKLLSIAEDWYGRLFIECNQYEQGFKLMISALERMKQVPNVEQEHIVVQLNDIGTVSDLLGRTDESISYFQEAIQLGKKVENMELGAMYINLGRAYIKKNLLNEARKNCGYGWKLGVITKNDDVKKEAELCLNQIKNST